MRDSARECPVSLGGSWLFRTKARKVAVSIELGGGAIWEQRGGWGSESAKPCDIYRASKFKCPAGRWRGNTEALESSQARNLDFPLL